MVCNGYEILSGSIRNHDAEVLIKAFEKVGKGEKEVKEREKKCRSRPHHRRRSARHA